MAGSSVDVGELARELGTTEYHLRRMFSSLAGMPPSEYVRRRRMSVAAGDVIGGEGLLSVGVPYGCGSTPGLRRAFPSVPGARPSHVRPNCSPLCSHPN